MYNRTVEYLKQPGTKADWKKIKTNIIKELPEWAKDVPYQIKSIAIRDACLAVKAAKRKFKQTRQLQEVHFKSKKKPKQTLYIPKSAVKENSFYVTHLGRDLNFREPLNPAGDCRLTLDSDRWFLCTPTNVTVSSENQGSGIVALDPGVRTFLTLFTETAVGKIGNRDFTRIYRLCYHLDRLMSKMTQVKAKVRYKLRKAAARLRWKIKDLIADLHHKVARWLCTNFNTIITTDFRPGKLAIKLHSKVARAMLGWSHYKFNQFLEHKAAELGTRVIRISEAYTSKTCSRCGHIQEIGSREVWTCKSCGTRWNRDYNGARGIFLRALEDTPSLMGLTLGCIG